MYKAHGLGFIYGYKGREKIGDIDMEGGAVGGADGAHCGHFSDVAEAGAIVGECGERARVGDGGEVIRCKVDRTGKGA